MSSKSQTQHHRKQTRQPAVQVEVDPRIPVWGAKAIGAVIGLSERQAFHLLECRAFKGAARKINGKWSAIPAKLLAQWGDQTTDERVTGVDQ